MQITMYISENKTKDKFVIDCLEKIDKGERSNRIKDLILKGLVFEGENIDYSFLDKNYGNFFQNKK